MLGKEKYSSIGGHTAGQHQSQDSSRRVVALQPKIVANSIEARNTVRQNHHSALIIQHDANTDWLAWLLWG